MRKPPLEGSVAIVTGAGRGIGQAVARRLAFDGASVAAADLDLATSAETVELVTEAGGVASSFPVDVRDVASVENLFNTAKEQFGRVDLLITCAGVIRDNLVHKLSDEDWDNVIGTHLTGTFNCARAAQRIMVSQGGGRMVFFSSIAARGNRGQANYSAAKAGIEGLARTLALELGRFDITVNTVAPGFVVTRMTQSVAERTGVDFEELKKSVADWQAIKRVGQPEDIADVVAFFCSDDARHVTGQTLVVGGNP